MLQWCRSFEGAFQKKKLKEMTAESAKDVDGKLVRHDQASRSSSRVMPTSDKIICIKEYYKHFRCKSSSLIFAAQDKQRYTTTPGTDNRNAQKPTKA